jgi:hypothetical protein
MNLLRMSICFFKFILKNFLKYGMVEYDAAPKALAEVVGKHGLKPDVFIAPAFGECVNLNLHD